MRSIIRLALYLPAMIAVAVPSFAQQLPDRNGNVFGNKRPPGSITIQSTVSMSIPVEGAGDANAQIASGQKAFYELAAGQCGLILGVLADECQIATINSNADLSRNGRAEVIVRGTVSMAVTLKTNAGIKP